MGGYAPAGGSTRSGAERGRVDPYPLVVRPLSAPPGAAPVVDLRGPSARRAAQRSRDDGRGRARSTTCGRSSPRRRARPRRELVGETIKPFNAHRGADHDQLRRVLDCLDAGRPVAFYGWWPTAELATTTEILGVDAMEVPPPDRKRTGLADGHAVVIVGYGRHAAFPGGGYSDRAQRLGRPRLG